MGLRIINIKGQVGRIEAKLYTNDNARNNPVVLVLHPLFLPGGEGENSMSSDAVTVLYQAFAKNDFNVLRINFRGTGNSEGALESEECALQDALTAFDWLQIENPNSMFYWIAGFSFGSWIAMELLMRRPEITNFITASMQVDKYEFSFLNPCPIPGLILHGDNDKIVDYNAVVDLVNNRTKARFDNTDLCLIKGANHFFHGHLRDMYAACYSYIENTMKICKTKGNYLYKKKKRKILQEN